MKTKLKMSIESDNAGVFGISVTCKSPRRLPAEMMAALGFHRIGTQAEAEDRLHQLATALGEKLSHIVLNSPGSSLRITSGPVPRFAFGPENRG